MDISVQTLEYFAVLAEELHFGIAARRLSISSPSLSQQISRLERTIGAALFERSPRRVHLTPVGEQLVPLARRAVEARGEVIAWAQSLGENRGEVLRVGIIAAGAGPVTTSILVSASARMPELRLELRRVGFFSAREELIAGRVDVVFAPGPFDDMPTDVSVTPLWREGRVLVVAASHRFAGRTSISIDECSTEVFVVATGGDPRTVGWWLVDPRPDGSHPRLGASADDVEGLFALCAAGAGVNIAGASAASHFRRDELAFVPIRDIQPATIALCSLAESARPAVRLFRQIAAEIAVPIGLIESTPAR